MNQQLFSGRFFKNKKGWIIFLALKNPRQYQSLQEKNNKKRIIFFGSAIFLWCSIVYFFSTRSGEVKLISKVITNGLPGRLKGHSVRLHNFFKKFFSVILFSMRPKVANSVNRSTRCKNGLFWWFLDKFDFPKAELPLQETTCII